MPYPRNTYFEPSTPYRKSWALAPQNRFLEVSGHKTRSMYDDLSSSIPFFYILMFAAIALDIYLGFAVLSKSGVNLILIVLSVVADFFLAILPAVLAGYISELNPINTKNTIFKINLECMTERINEDDENFRSRVNGLKYGDLKEKKKNLLKFKIVEYIMIALIVAIAIWKIYTFYSVIPPSMSIFSVANGKIVILCSVLCAIFHIIGSEKAFAHLLFWTRKGKEFKSFNSTNTGKKPEVQILPVQFKGDYKEASFKNTSLKLKEDGKAEIHYYHVIWDDEIKQIIQRQGDDSARRGVVITCKENQIF